MIAINCTQSVIFGTLRGSDGSLLVRPVRSRIRLVVAVALVGLVLATILAVQHFLPASVSPVTAPGISANCTTMLEDSSFSPVTPESGTILFGCSARPEWPPTSLGCSDGCPSAYPALNVSGGADYTPVFKLPQYYTGLFVAMTSGCPASATSGSSPAQLTNGTDVRLSSSSASRGFYYYCASYAGVGSTGATLSGFTISWRSGSGVVSQTFPSVTIARTSAFSVVRGSDNVLYYSTYAGAWSGWRLVGSGTAGVPVLCSGGSIDNLYLVARGSDNISILVKRYSNGVWSGWTSPPGGATSAQPACALMNGTLHLLVRGEDGALHYNSLDQTSGIWNGWQPLNGTLISPPVLAASPSLNRLDVVVEGASGSIWHKAFLNGAWSQTWDSPAGITSTTPAVTSDGQTLHLVVVGVENVVWYSSLNFTTNLWSSWQSLGGTTAVPPSLARDSSGTVHLLVVGLDKGIYYKSLPAGGVWSSSWGSPGGITSEPIAVTAQGSDILIMVSGTNGSISYNTLSASVWRGWTPLGGSTSIEPALSSIS